MVPPKDQITMYQRPNSMLIAVFIACSACAAKKDDWANIDYSKVYRAAGERQIDSGYRPSTSVISCVDDDLYNCR